MPETITRQLRHGVRTAGRKLGVDITRYPPKGGCPVRRQRLLEQAGIDLVFDVGAFEGQYALELRRHGYLGRIVSFEPLAAPYAVLSSASRRDPAWAVRNLAMGDVEGVSLLHVAGNLTSSSFLEMRPEHADAAPGSAYQGNEEVQVTTLDSVFGVYRQPGDRVFLKIDTQGYEHRVLAGAGGCLTQIEGVQLEMSLVPLYEGQMLYREAIDLMQARGLSLMSIEPGFSDPGTGRLLQADGVFFRSTPTPGTSPARPTDASCRP